MPFIYNWSFSLQIHDKLFRFYFISHVLHMIDRPSRLISQYFFKIFISFFLLNFSKLDWYSRHE
uniref:Uncharacterized protein n=1 Tax=Rhizophora mucronata TaxID=61149 RepID=A0A2P2IS14_RHIMU